MDFPFREPLRKAREGLSGGEVARVDTGPVWALEPLVVGDEKEQIMSVVSGREEGRVGPMPVLAAGRSEAGEARSEGGSGEVERDQPS